MLNNRHTRFITLPSTQALLDKLQGLDERAAMQPIIHLDAAWKALEAGLSLNEVMEQARLQVEHDILERILEATNTSESANRCAPTMLRL